MASTYTKEDDCDPALIILSTNSKSEWNQYTLDSASQPEVAESFVSPFAGITVQAAARYLHENAVGTVLSARYFFIADEQTVKDNTLLLVQIDWDNPEIVQTLRMAGNCANAEAVSLAVGTGGFEELISMAGEDGVYRGDPSEDV